MEIYKTIQKESVDEFIERRSRFIGYIKPIENESEAVSFIEKIKTKHWDARHNVYAYSLLENNIIRYSDDGEPQGTAGVPVLDILRKNEVTNAVIVVTRYFGGILLGTGGLVRAYSHAAKLALDSAGIITMALCSIVQLDCDYNMYGKISSGLVSAGANIEDSQFLDKVSIRLSIPKTEFQSLQKKITDISSGAIKLDILCEEFKHI